MAYSHVTWGALKTALAGRLHDTSNVFFTSTECGLYLAEALRTFNALSAFWRERGTFNTVANTIFYDLPTQLSTLLGYTITDRDVVNLMQYHLLEAPNSWGTSTAWGGTEQFTMADLEDSIERRRNQFLADTGMVLTSSSVAQPAPPVGRVALTDSVIDVRRLTWTDTSNVVYRLWREDEFALNAFSGTWALDATTPYAYSVMGPPPVTIQIAAVPADAGTLGMLSVNTGAALDVVTGVTLGIPDDFAWVVKWGALADILGKDGPAYDPARAAWCEQRYQMGCLLARNTGCIVQAQLQGVNLFVDSLHNMDAAYWAWENETAGSVTDIGVAGYNMIAVRPKPSGIMSLTFDVIKKAPVPTADATNVQLGREQIDMILDYAEHLAMFKVAGEEWQATERQASNFVKQAMTYNNRLQASAAYAIHAAGFSRKESVDHVRTVNGPALGALQGAGQ